MTNRTNKINRTNRTNRTDRTNRTNHSELRQDPVSGDWVLMATGRAKRPDIYKSNKSRRIYQSKKKCPFEKIFETHKPILVYRSKKDWTVVVVENKYPAVTHKDHCVPLGRRGFYTKIDGSGYHDLVITRDHHRNFAQLSIKQANRVMEAFRERYLMLSHDRCLAYISIFHNWGPAAGASIYHPHYQMIAIPVIPPDVGYSLKGSRRFFKTNKKCVYCLMIDYEKKEKKRIIFENAGAIVFTPYVSREPFELRIFPKKHLPYFENTPTGELISITKALQFALQRIDKKLNRPDYNFFIHTAPLQNKRQYSHYHWHIEILPKLNISAGFELGTGIEINVVNPDEAAKILRN